MTENQLNLIVKEKTLGSLITNAKDIKNFVVAKLETYSVDNYQGDAKDAAKDKAELNNAAKQLNDERIKLEKEFMQPFNEFKDVVNETVSLIKDASSKLDAIVKAKENEEKDAKKSLIVDMWNSRKFDLVPLERVFNPKWLNKTCKLTSIEAEINSIIDTINNDLKALMGFGDDTAELRTLYLSTLNLQSTLSKGAELKANRERLESMESEKVCHELTAITNEIVEDAKAEQKKAAAPVKNENINQISSIKYTFNVIGNESQIELVRSIANNCGIQAIPSISFVGSKDQVEAFRKEMGLLNLSYDKMNFLSLRLN